LTNKLGSDAKAGCTDSFSDWTSPETIGIGEELSMDQRDRFFWKPQKPKIGSFIINCRGPEHFPVNINSGEYVNHGWLGVLLFLSVRSQKKTILIGLFSSLKNRRNIENWRYSGKKKNQNGCTHIPMSNPLLKNSPVNKTSKSLLRHLQLGRREHRLRFSLCAHHMDILGL